MSSASAQNATPKLTLGPVLFNWEPEIWRDFYFKIADETPIDTVYLGDVICAKRAALVEKMIPGVTDRLIAGGKNIVRSTLSLVIDDLDAKLSDTVSKQDVLPVEANDMAVIPKLKGRSFYIGPYINSYNEDTLLAFKRRGAVHITMPFELSGKSIKIMAETAAENGMTSEVTVYGRVPLSVSNRCYHAQAYGRERQGCQYACKGDPDGKTVTDMMGHKFLVINGKQTMTHTCINLIHAIPEMIKNGVTHFRLSPHSCDMVLVSQIFNNILYDKSELEHSVKTLKEFGFGSEFSNGFYYGRPGHEWVDVA